MDAGANSARQAHRPAACLWVRDLAYNSRESGCNVTIGISKETAVTARPATTTTTPAARLPGTVAITHEELAHLLHGAPPRQGLWSQDDYLRLTDCTNRLIEWTDGCIEVLPMPTDEHQSIAAYLYKLLDAYALDHGGKVLFAPLRVRIREGAFREPDLVLVRDAHDTRRRNRFWLGTDLAVEIVSPDNPKRDLVDKRRDYAEAGIPEYWIVDPRNETVTVLALQGAAYVEHGVFARGARADSVLLDGLTVDVAAVFDAAG